MTMTHQELIGEYSDTHKDIYGVRWVPEGLTTEELLEALNNLYVAAKRQAKLERNRERAFAADAAANATFRVAVLSEIATCKQLFQKLEL